MGYVQEQVDSILGQALSHHLATVNTGMVA